MTDLLEFLKHTPPFEKLPQEELEAVAGQLEEKRHEKAGVIYQQHKTKIHCLDIIFSGGYEIFFYNSEGRKELSTELGPHATYGAFSILLNKGKSIHTVSAHYNTVVYQLPDHLFKKLCQTYDPFTSIFSPYLAKKC